MCRRSSADGGRRNRLVDDGKPPKLIGIALAWRRVGIVNAEACKDLAWAETDAAPETCQIDHHGRLTSNTLTRECRAPLRLHTASKHSVQARLMDMSNAWLRASCRIT